MTLEIVQVPHPVLRRRALEVEDPQDVLELVEQMIATALACRHPRAVGLAAPQVGISLRAFVWRSGEGDEFLAAVNPEIVERGGEQVDEEGCLSVPGRWQRRRRAARVTMVYLDPRGAGEESREAAGFEARILQHEVDHLNGRLFTDPGRGQRR